MFQSKRQKVISSIIFIIYGILLVWLVLFKFSTDLGAVYHPRIINLIPFQASMIVDGEVEVREIIYNVLVFVPLGVYVSMFQKDWSLAKKILSCMLVSLTFESLQFIFEIGVSDITDLIGNTLGGTMGILLCSLIQRVFKRKFVVLINSIGGVIELMAFFIIGVSIYASY